MNTESRPKLRLYTEAPLTEGAEVDAPQAQAHYLRNVMRAGLGTILALFNGRDGEWRGEILTLSKSSCRIRLIGCLRQQIVEPDVWLLFAPLKKDPTDWLVEKAVELGVSVLQPVLTRHTAATRVNVERLRAHGIEAAEQCERLTVPEVRAPVTLEKLVKFWPRDRTLIYADESGRSPSLRDVLAEAQGPHAFLIGPEGGFAQSELDALAQLSFAVGVGLGPRILRAETAAVAALGCYQALCGDWNGRPPPRPHI